MTDGEDKKSLFFSADAEALAEPAHPKNDDSERIQRYMVETGKTGSVSYVTPDGKLTTPAFKENSQASFAMHSVGKVFTTMLVLIMIRKGVFTADDMTKPPVKLDPSIQNFFPPAVRDAVMARLQEVSLHQLITHTAGVGEYIHNYVGAISESKGSPPEIKTPEDFLPFADGHLSPIGEKGYSNLGFVLLGLALKHAYEKKYGPCEYEQILREHIIDKVGMPSFKTQKPNDAKVNPNDPLAPQIVGGPAGGYWVTAEDLTKFGRWIYQQTQDDPELETLMNKYCSSVDGHAMYHAEGRIVEFGGSIPNSSSAFFSVSLKTGSVVSTLSDQPDTALNLNAMVQNEIIPKPPQAQAKKH